MLGRSSLFTLSALSMIFASLGVHAHTTQTSGNNLFVTVPDLRPGFEMSLTALALKPGASNLNYVIYNKALPAQSPAWTEKEINPGFGPAFDLGVRFIFPEGKDVSLDWMHLNTSDSTSVATPNFEYFLGPDYEIGPSGIPIRNATGSSQFRYDVINLDAGQFVDFGPHTEFRFFGGLSNTYLKEQVHARFSGNTITGQYQGPFSTKQMVTANFTGIGPRFGMEGRYHTDSGFGFIGKAAMSALIGYSHAKTDYVSNAQQLLDVFGQDLNYQTIEDKRVRQVIPGFDAKLGLYYKHQLNNCYIFSIEGGYMGAVYVNAIQQYLPASLVAGQPLESGGIFVATMSHTQSNYSVQGPYLGATLQFA